MLQFLSFLTRIRKFYPANLDVVTTFGYNEYFISDSSVAAQNDYLNAMT